MSRLTECAALRTSTGGLPCSVGEARSRLDPESAADFDAWVVGDLPISDGDMHTALQSLGFRVGRQTVGRHRRGHCRCAGAV